jgi:uncharacterized metal-binding protein YceD (DUF177 family)
LAIKRYFYTFAKIFQRVNPLKDYIIQIDGIKDGLHRYDYIVNKLFTDQFNYEDVLDIEAHVEVSMFKTNQLFNFTISLTGKILVECDRCLDEFHVDIAFDNHFSVKLEDNAPEENDEIIFIPTHSKEFDVAPYVFETIVFAVPMKKVHPNDKSGKSLCNPDVISKLDKHIINENEPIDPRWDKLKELLN